MYCTYFVKLNDVRIDDLDLFPSESAFPAVDWLLGAPGTEAVPTATAGDRGLEETLLTAPARGSGREAMFCWGMLFAADPGMLLFLYELLLLLLLLPTPTVDEGEKGDDPIPGEVLPGRDCSSG